MEAFEMKVKGFGTIILTPFIRSAENREVFNEIMLDPEIYTTLSICANGEKPTSKVLDTFYEIFVRFDKKMKMGLFKIEEKKTKNLIGISGLIIADPEDPKPTPPEVVYLLKKKFSGKKIGQTLSAYFVKYGFECGIKEQASCALTTNLASQKILLKSGLKFRNTARRPNGSLVNYFSATIEEYSDTVDAEYIETELQKIQKIDTHSGSFEEFVDEFGKAKRAL